MLIKNGMKDFLKEAFKSIVALLIVGGAILSPYLIYSASKTREAENRIIANKLDSLENVITNMQNVDTLILNISEYNSKDIEVMGERQDEIKARVLATERQIQDLNDELDSYD